MSQSYELTEHAQKRLEERDIPLKWVESALFSPQRVEQNPKDPELMCALATIPEFGHRVLRVIYNPTTKPIKVITAHFDRSMKGKL